MAIEKIVDMIVRAMLVREAEGKEFGVIVLAEGLAAVPAVELPRRDQVRRPRSHLAGADQPGPDHGQAVEAEYKKRTGKSRRRHRRPARLRARCALPHAFDVILGSQLGVGAYRALVEKSSSTAS